MFPLKHLARKELNEKSVDDDVMLSNNKFAHLSSGCNATAISLKRCITMASHDRHGV